MINHGIDTTIMEKIEEKAMEFFMLSHQEKQKYAMKAGTVQGYGQAFVFSEHQKLDWCNMFALGVHPHSIRNQALWSINNPLNFRYFICHFLLVELILLHFYL